jgi:hypothetical protein
MCPSDPAFRIFDVVDFEFVVFADGLIDEKGGAGGEC